MHLSIAKFFLSGLVFPRQVLTFLATVGCKEFSDPLRYDVPTCAFFVVFLN